MTDNHDRWQALACTLTGLPQRLAAMAYLVGYISDEVDPKDWDRAVAHAIEYGRDNPLPLP